LLFQITFSNKEGKGRRQRGTKAEKIKAAIK